MENWSASPQVTDWSGASIAVADQIYLRRDGGAWQQIPGAYIHVSCNHDGSVVWGVNRTHQIFRRAGDAWHPVDGALRQLTVSADGAWVVGVNAVCAL